jgi:hypothetical protein
VTLELTTEQEMQEWEVVLNKACSWWAEKKQPKNPRAASIIM